MEKIVKDILLTIICGRLLYIEPVIELTILEIIVCSILFIEFNFKEYFLKLFSQIFK